MMGRLSIPQLFKNNTAWLEKRQSSILSAATVIMVANIASSISGLFRNQYIESAFGGISYQSKQLIDAFWLAFQIPDLLFQLIVLGALSAAFIPVFKEVKEKDEQQSFKMASSVINNIILVLSLIAVLVFIFAKEITIFRTGHAIPDEQLHTTIQLTRMLILSPILLGLSNFLTGILQSYQRFAVPALASLAYNIGIIGGIWLFSDALGIYSAGVGVILGASVHMLMQVIPVRNVGFRYTPTLNWGIPGVKKVIKLMPARMLTYAVFQLQLLANGFFITSLPGGGFRLLTYAMQIITIPIRWFGVSIGQASLPFLSDQSHEKDASRFQALLIQSLNQVSFLVFPSAVLLIILRIPVTRFYNFHDWQDTLLTAKIVGIMATCIFAHSLSNVLVRAFHALTNTLTPLLITMASVVVYLLSAYALTLQFGWGLVGLAVANCIAALLEFGLLAWYIHRSVVPLFTRSLLETQAKILIASFIMAVFLYLPFRILDDTVFETSRIIELIAFSIITSTIGMLVYIYVAYVLQLKELQFITKILDSLGLWKSSIAKTSEVIVDSDGE